MADSREAVFASIPHRPPFLWVDRIIRRTGDEIETEYLVPDELPLFSGHYPGYPLMPGVILCEAVFQSGAILLAGLGAAENGLDQARPVLTRIIQARFKREVRPGELIKITVKIKERVGPAWFMKGRLKTGGKTAVQVEFACALASGGPKAR